MSRRRGPCRRPSGTRPMGSIGPRCRHALRERRSPVGVERRPTGARMPYRSARPAGSRSPAPRTGARPKPPHPARSARTARIARPLRGDRSVRTRPRRGPRLARRAAAPRGRNAITTPGRSTARRPAISASTDEVSGSATPAPSLDSPSAANAPRWASAARPARASGRTFPAERPPASATNPTPHASCSNRAS